VKTLNSYRVDAFASSLFTGNQAAVCPLDKWLTDDQMQSIAEENNLYLKYAEVFEVIKGDYYFLPNKMLEELLS